MAGGRRRVLDGAASAGRHSVVTGRPQLRGHPSGGGLNVASSSQLRRCVPTLRVRDASAACQYFCDQLGFAKDWEHRFGPGLPLFVSVSRDGVSLHLSEHTGDGPLEVRIYVYVEDPRALFTELKSRGARIVA